MQSRTDIGPKTKAFTLQRFQTFHTFGETPVKVPDGGHSVLPMLPLSSEGQKVVGAGCANAFPHFGGL